MKRNRSPLRHLAGSMGAVLLTGLLAGCSEAIPTAPGSDPPLAAAKGNRPSAGSLSVSAVDPDTVPADTVLTVRVLGSGFTEGSDVTWELAGTTTDAVTTVAPVIFVSAKELHARIAVAPDAPLARYDVVVTAAGGKRGIGVESLQVVARPIPLPIPQGMVQSDATDVNDLGVIVGWGVDASDVFHALRWTPTTGGWTVEEVPSAFGGPGISVSAEAVNNGGDILLHRWAAFDPRVPRAFSILTREGHEVPLEADWVHDLNDAGTVIGAYRGGPVAWLRTASDTWSAPSPLPSVPGYRAGDPMDINLHNEIAGSVVDAGGARWPAVWRFAGGAWTVPEIASGGFPGGLAALHGTGGLAGVIQPCGGQGCNAVPAYWSSITAAPLPLLPDDGSNAGGSVADMNDDRLIVGRAWLRAGKRGGYVLRAVAWRPGSEGLADLGALNGSQSSETAAVSNGWPGIAVGHMDQYRGGKRAYAWLVY